jgi:hypothetical protein
MIKIINVIGWPNETFIQVMDKFNEKLQIHVES